MALLSRIRAHKVAALILISLATLSSSIFVHTFTTPQGVSCPSNAKPFQDSTMPPRTVFQLPPPGRASICLTVQISGELPPGGLYLVPSLGLYTTSQSGSTYSACSNSWTNCGGVAVSASPAYAFSPSQALHIVVTINAPGGSTLGVYGLWFWACSGGTMLWLRVSRLNQTLPNRPNLVSDCPLPPYHVLLAFNSYAGMIPVYQNGTIPALD
jgi:hypothetical protein